MRLSRKGEHGSRSLERIREPPSADTSRVANTNVCVLTTQPRGSRSGKGYSRSLRRLRECPHFFFRDVPELRESNSFFLAKISVGVKTRVSREPSRIALRARIFANTHEPSRKTPRSREKSRKTRENPRSSAKFSRASRTLATGFPRTFAKFPRNPANFREFSRNPAKVHENARNPANFRVIPLRAPRFANIGE